jgi:hypothetical protein
MKREKTLFIFFLQNVARSRSFASDGVLRAITVICD